MTAAVPADDRFAILDVQARYARALDTADPEGYAALFAPDGVCEIAGDVYAGREAITAYIRRLTGVETWSGYRHHNSQVLFEEGDDSRCRVSCYSTIMVKHRDGTIETRLQGFYRDVMVKIEGMWYFAERRWEQWDLENQESYRPAPR